MKTKLLGSLAIVLGVFLFVGVASASDADLLQPASDVVYNENVDINGSLDVDSLRVGTAGQGGVTFFNGTVLNEGADPFTVGDDMRVDGEIYRTEKGGANPIKISDHMVPTLTNTNDFGSTTNRWNNIYAKDGNYSGVLYVGSIWYNNDVTRRLSIPGAEFLPHAGPCAFTRSVTTGHIFNKTANCDYITALNLPDNAKISYIRMKYQDNSAAAFTVKLYRSDYKENTSQLMGTLTSQSNSSSWKTYAIFDNDVYNDIDYNSIYNDDYYYYLATDNMDAANTHRLGGVTISYKVKSP